MLILRSISSAICGGTAGVGLSQAFIHGDYPVRMLAGVVLALFIMWLMAAVTD